MKKERRRRRREKKRNKPIRCFLSSFNKAINVLLLSFFLSSFVRSFVRVGYNIALDCVFLIKHLCFIISITTKPNFHCYFNFLLSIKCTHTLLGPISFSSSSSFSFRVSLLCSIKNRVSRENIFTFGQCKPLI